MGFFDDLGKKLSDASQDVMQKGKEMADTSTPRFMMKRRKLQLFTAKSVRSILRFLRMLLPRNLRLLLKRFMPHRQRLQRFRKS